MTLFFEDVVGKILGGKQIYFIISGCKVKIQGADFVPFANNLYIHIVFHVQFLHNFNTLNFIDHILFLRIVCDSQQNFICISFAEILSFQDAVFAVFVLTLYNIFCTKFFRVISD